MKLAFSTLGCSDRSLEQIIGCAKRFSVTGIEVRGISGKMNIGEIPDFFPENIGRTKKLLCDNNIELVCFGTSCSFHNKEKYDDMLKKGVEAVDVCQKVGIPAIRVFGNNIKPDEPAGDIIARVADGIYALCEYAGNRNVDVFFEVHGDFNSVGTVEPIVRRNECHKNFGLLWDVEHSDTVYKDNWRDFYYPLKPYIRHIHIKDGKRPECGKETQLTLVGQGDIPLCDIVRTLEADGFDGWYSLEWEKKWKSYLPEIEEALPGYLSLMNGCK